MLKLAEVVHPIDKELYVRYLYNNFLELMTLKDWEGSVEKRKIQRPGSLVTLPYANIAGAI